MSESEYRQEVEYYVSDIAKFARAGDFGSARIMLTGLKKLMDEYKKFQGKKFQGKAPQRNSSHER